MLGAVPSRSWTKFDQIFDFRLLINFFTILLLFINLEFFIYLIRGIPVSMLPLFLTVCNLKCFSNMLIV